MSRGSKRLVIVAVVVLLSSTLGVVGAVVVHMRGTGLAVHDLGDGTVVSPAGVGRVSITTADPDALDRVTVLLDGMPVEAQRDGDRISLRGVNLTEGPHRLSVSADNSMPLLPDSLVQREFTVDGTPPELAVEFAGAESPDGPVTVRGQAEGAESVLVGDQRVPVLDGRFETSLPASSARLRVEARDKAGNAERHEVDVKVHHPGMRAVHMSAVAWAAAELREPVLAMARERRIDTVQLDIKDESGEVGYESQVPLARRIGATRNHYDARAVTDELHRMGLRVVGRLVAFRDPVLAEASWREGARDRVVQDAAGNPWTGGYGGFAFTNFANGEVRDYNLALAEEAASLGFDDILYDYVRRPDAPIGRLAFPGLQGTPEQSIVDFLRVSRDAVRPHGAYLGASVFGIAAHSPQDVAQDIPAMAAVTDYIAPMVYPSHWGPGEHGVDQPESQPHAIVLKSVQEFVRLTKDSGTAVIPWLQAFSLAKPYGPTEVQAQIAASAEAGAPSFLLWDPACTYDDSGLQPV
jgi:hypothetical protein